MKGFARTVAAFLAGAVLLGALVELAVEYGIMEFDLRILGSATFVGGVVAASVLNRVRLRRIRATRQPVNQQAREGE